MANFDQFLREFEVRPTPCPPRLPQPEQRQGWGIRIVSLWDVLVGMGRFIIRCCLILYAIAFWSVVALIIVMTLALALAETWR